MAIYSLMEITYPSSEPQKELQAHGVEVEVKWGVHTGFI